MKWKSRRRDVPKRLEPSLSDGAPAEEEGLDLLILLSTIITFATAINHNRYEAFRLLNLDFIVIKLREAELASNHRWEICVWHIQ